MFKNINFISLTIFFLLISFFFTSSSHFRTYENEQFYLSNNSVFSVGDKIIVRIGNNKYFNDFTFRLLKISNPLLLVKNDYYSHYYNIGDIFNWEGENLLKFVKVIKEWKKSFDFLKVNQYEFEVEVGKISEPGIYYLQAISNKKVAYCPIIVSDYTLVYKNLKSQIVSFIANSKTGKIEKNTRFEVYTDKKLTDKKLADKDGLAFFDFGNSNFINNQFLIIGYINDEFVFTNPHIYFNPEDSKNYLGYIYTNQPVYGPGQQVNFKGISRMQKGNELVNVENEKFAVSIKSSKGKEVYSSILKSNEFGSLSGNFNLQNEADIGDYYIQITKDNKLMFGNFSVEEYRKPEYKVSVSTTKKNYLYNDEIEGKVTADYYFGSKVTQAKVQLKIYRKKYWYPWWFWSEYAWFYKNFYRNSYWYDSPQFVTDFSGELDKNGEYSFRFPINSEKESDYAYDIIADVTDNSRFVVSGSSNVFVTRGAFSLSATSEKYYVKVKNPIKIKVNAFDFSNNPIKTEVKLIVNKSIWNNHNNYEETVATLKGNTDENGKASFSFCPDEKGYYKFTAISIDENRNEITASGSFFASDGEADFYHRTENGIEIITDKDTYQKGDTLSAIIFFPVENFDAFVSFENTSFIKFNKHYVKGNSLEINEIINDNFGYNFNLSVTFVKDRKLFSNNKLIGVLPTDKFLNVFIVPSKNEFKPGEKANYKLIVKDNEGNLCKNSELSFGLVDESVYAIKDEIAQNIQSFFYAPQYINAYSNSSLNTWNGYTYCREITELDQHFFNEDNETDLSKNKSKVFGKIKFKYDYANYSNVNVILVRKSKLISTKLDTGGNFIFEDILFGTYDLVLKSKTGTFAYIKKIKIKNETINLGELEISNNFWNGQIFGDAQTIISESNSGLFLTGRRANMVSILQDKNTLVKSKSFPFESQYQQATTREKFSDAPYWNSSIITNEKGEANISFDLPDNLTTWRATVRGVTNDSKFGQNINLVIARKNLLVRIEPPRFFREDDRLIISTIVHNYLSEKKKVKISFNVKNLKLLNSFLEKEIGKFKKLNSNTYEILLEKNSEQRINWEVEVNSPIGDAELFAEALTNEESDAIKIKVPILPKGLKQINPLNAEIENETEKSLTFNISDNIDLNTVSLSFSINPSIATTLLKSLDELIAYPYGCVEQTMSRFLPAIVVANAFNKIKIPLKEKSIEELPKVIEQGLKRLYSFQHSDGGWGWWQNDNTHPFMTAYVIYGLSIAKEAGYKIDENILNNGINNLFEQIKNNQLIDNTTLSYMLYSFSSASKNNSSRKNDIIKFANKLLNEDLNPYSLSLLGLSYINMKEKLNIDNIIKRLQSLSINKNNYNYWGGKAWHYNWQEDKVQSTAFAVKFLISCGINSDVISKSVYWLLSNQKGYSWNSTQETSAVIFALIDYLKMTDELEPNYNVKISLNDVEVFDQLFNSKNLFENSKRIEISGIDSKLLKTGLNKISIIKNGKGKLYFSGFEKHFDKNNISSNENYFTIKKEYYAITPHQTKDGIIYKKSIVNDEVKSGENILVKIFIESNSSKHQYLMVEDMFPSGFEIIKDEEHYKIEDESNYGGTENYILRPWRWFYADREVRDEKVSFFVTYPNDKMEFTYLLKAIIPGSYNIMPAESYLMYYPEVFGNSEMKNIVVVEK